MTEMRITRNDWLIGLWDPRPTHFHFHLHPKHTQLTQQMCARVSSWSTQEPLVTVVAVAHKGADTQTFLPNINLSIRTSWSVDSACKGRQAQNREKKLVLLPPGSFNHLWSVCYFFFLDCCIAAKSNRLAGAADAWHRTCLQIKIATHTWSRHLCLYWMSVSPPSATVVPGAEA